MDLKRSELKKMMRLDDDLAWITVNGTHVEIDHETGQITKGPEELQKFFRGGGSDDNSMIAFKTHDIDYKLAGSFAEFQKENMRGRDNPTRIALTELYKEGGLDAVKQEYYSAKTVDSTSGLHLISDHEADEVLAGSMSQNTFDGWFRDANSEYKPRVVEAVIESPETRNAALSIMYENYKQLTDGKLDYDEFLTTPLEIYRGGHGQDHTKDDIFSSYTFSKDVAGKFAGENGTVYSASIRPIDTWGSVTTNKESEIMVPSWIAPNGNKDGKDTDDRYRILETIKAKYRMRTGENAMDSNILKTVRVIKAKYMFRELSERYVRLDADDGEWVTVNGAHIMINEKGDMIGGSVEARENITGGVVSGKNGDLIAKSDGAKAINTSEALEQLKRGEDNSLAKYLDDDGNLSPERQAMHNEIIRELFANKVSYDGQGTMIMSGGGPASGKTFVKDAAYGQFGEETVVKVDPDDFKTILFDKEVAAGLEGKSGDDAAPYYHEESSALTKMAYRYALDNNINVVYDGTGNGSLRSVESKINAARDAGYAVKAQYVTIDTQEAVERNRQRYIDGMEKYARGETDKQPRLVPDNQVVGTHEKVSDIVPKVAGLYDTFELFDNNGAKGEQYVIGTCKYGEKLTTVSGMEKQMQAFLDKGKDGYTINDDGTVG